MNLVGNGFKQAGDSGRCGKHLLFEHSYPWVHLPYMRIQCPRSFETHSRATQSFQTFNTVYRDLVLILIFLFLFLLRAFF